MAAAAECERAVTAPSVTQRCHSVNVALTMSWRCMYATLQRNRYLHMTLVLRASLTSSLVSIQFSVTAAQSTGSYLSVQ